MTLPFTTLPLLYFTFLGTFEINESAYDIILFSDSPDISYRPLLSNKLEQLTSRIKLSYSQSFGSPLIDDLD